MIVFPFEEPKNGSYKVFVLFIADNVPAASTTKGSEEHPIIMIIWPGRSVQFCHKLYVPIKNECPVISSNINTEMCF